MVKISVVIPAFNEEKFLARCLESLRNQDYEGVYEIIVVDNGSNDNTVQTARSFGVRVISCPQRGTVRARDAGFKSSSGETIVQADADTVYPADWLSRIDRHFSSHPEAIAVAGDVVYTGSPFWARPLQFFRRLINRLSFRFLGKTPFCLAAVFAFRRQALLKAGGYNINLPFIGDEHDVLVRLSKVGKIVYDGHLLAETSSRRFTGRMWQFLLVDMFYGTIVEQIWFRVTGRSLTRTRACPRAEHAGQRRFFLRHAWSLATTCIIVGILGWGYFSPSSDVFGNTYARAASPEKVIALTFDDGPNEPYTSQILDILSAHGVKATFFVIGKNVEYYPDVAKRIVAEGHVLGNHSYTHRPLTEFDVPDYSELDRAQNVIYETTGVRPRLFRPPYGRKTPWELEYVKKKGLITVTWSVSANDPHKPPPETIENRIVHQVRPGAIILLHDGNGTQHGSDRSRTVEALPKIIESLQAQGYTFVTVPELLEVSPYIE
jgi:peptidoglycan/xylan/chitin deacetylase (PgdA/CDA1 family)/glycosyltransferase involved in cell wall biosynthesis